MYNTFSDNRYELIGKYKQRIIESTNIETSEDEMKVIDNILFRMWQMGWLDRMEKQEPMKPVVVDHWHMCPRCHDKYGFSYYILFGMKGLKTGEVHCGNCGQAIDWIDEENEE